LIGRGILDLVNVHLVDGTFELFRSYFGAPRAQGTHGQEVGAVRGILRSLGALLKHPEVTHVAAAFDTVIESFRNDVFPGYKSSAGVDTELLSQFPLAERATHALGIVVWSMVEFEADDAIATAALRFGPAADQVVIGSPDKDLCQCISGDRIVSFDSIRRRMTSESDVVAKFGVAPRSIPDWLALVGDSADGLPGVPRWGAKSAAALLSRYGHLEDIPKSEAEWDVPVRGSAALGASLREHLDRAYLYRELATLRTDVPLDETLDDLRWRGARRTALEAVCAEIGDESVMDAISAWRSD
jgi:5'-3' exonuclease